MTPPQMIGFLRSTSFVAAYLRTLAQAEASQYLGALEAEFAALAGDDPVNVDFELSMTLGRRV